MHVPVRVYVGLPWRCNVIAMFGFVFVGAVVEVQCNRHVCVRRCGPCRRGVIDTAPCADVMFSRCGPCRFGKATPLRGGGKVMLALILHRGWAPTGVARDHTLALCEILGFMRPLFPKSCPYPSNSAHIHHLKLHEKRVAINYVKPSAVM